MATFLCTCCPSQRVNHTNVTFGPVSVCVHVLSLSASSEEFWSIPGPQKTERRTIVNHNERGVVWAEYQGDSLGGLGPRIRLDSAEVSIIDPNSSPS